MSMQEVQNSLNSKQPLKYGIYFDSDKEEAKVFLSSLLFVANHSPQDLKNHLFSWKGDRTITLNKAVVLIALDSTSVEGKKVLNEMRRMQAGGVDKGLDALTVVKKKEDEMVTVEAHFFLDKMRDASADDAVYTTKLVVALAHEIYGNVQMALDRDFSQATPQYNDMKVRRANERYAFSAGIRFIESLKTHRDYDKLSFRIKTEFDRRLEEEKKALASWTR